MSLTQNYYLITKYSVDDALNELYQSVILDHNRHPRNKRTLNDQCICSQGYNPSCGDNITVFARIDNGLIHEITFYGEGCAISQASASLMTELLTGKSIEESNSIINMFLEMLHSDNTISDSQITTLGDVCALSGVKKFPMRIKCATLAWHAANDAIKLSKSNSVKQQTSSS